MESNITSDGDPFLLLPDELLVSTCAYLTNGADLARLACACRRFHHLANEKTLWRRLCLRRNFYSRAIDGDWKQYYIKKLHKAPQTVNKLAVLTATGNVLMCDPDGSNIVYLTNDATADKKVMYQQPTWSPLSNTIAVSKVKRSTMEYFVVLFNLKGEVVSETKTQYPGFYFYWHPDNEKLTFLANSIPNTLSLSLVDYDVPSGSQVVDLLETGRPTFYTWSPKININTDLDGYLCHLSSQVLIFRPCNSDRKFLPHAALRANINVEGLGEQGIYSAPVWLPQNFFVTIVSDEPRKQQHLVLLDPASLVNVIQDRRNPKGHVINNTNGFVPGSDQSSSGAESMDVDNSNLNTNSKKRPVPPSDESDEDEQQKIIEMLSSSLGVDLSALLTSKRKKPKRSKTEGGFEEEEDEDVLIEHTLPVLSLLSSWTFAETEYNYRVFDAIASPNGQFLSFFRNERLVICNVNPKVDYGRLVKLLEEETLQDQVKLISSNENITNRQLLTTSNTNLQKKNREIPPPNPTIVEISPDDSYKLDRIMGFCFSPNSKYLLSLHKIGGLYRWQIYNVETSKIYIYSSFRSCGYFESIYLPFSAQYFQSLTLFSPDSECFVYPADNAIYTQKVESSSLPQLIGPGVFATWSNK
jgi:hypothetical protein